jgi:ethanolamine transporter EutH
MGASQPHPEGTSAMNHRHRKVLHAIFSHPVSANIDPKAVEAVFEELGAEVSHNGSGRLAVKLGSHAHAFHNTQHSLSKDEVVAIRHFLTQSGVDPARDYPL